MRDPPKRRARIATILVIDDEAEVRQTLVRMLVGHAVHEAADGGAGLALAAELTPDLVVTDILMPEKEGIETIRELRRAHPSVRILAISGGGQSGTLDFLDMARALGADAALAKPFRRGELIETIDRLLAE